MDEVQVSALGAELDRLHEEHRRYAQQLEELLQKPYLSEDEQIEEIRLKGTTGFRGGDSDFTNNFGPAIPGNGVLLKAISVVKKRG